MNCRNSGGKESKAEIAEGGGCAASASASASSSSSAIGKASMFESDCDRSQSSVSGASWGRSSFRATRAGKVDLRSPRWMDSRSSQGNNGHGGLTDDNAVVSFPTIKRKFSAGSHENRDRASPSSHQTENAPDSHDEGYLSHSTADGGYQSGGYHSYHPALSYAPSVKSDIATVCSGSVVEDIDMAEVASVASDGGGKKGIPPQFASNILNDMGPPQTLCSALLLAANAACRPSSASLRSFDINDDKSAVSDVVAHVDTDDCCDRSVTQSEVSTLHSQDDVTSEHKEEMMDESANDMSPEAGLKGSLLHHTSEPSLAPVNSRRSRGGFVMDICQKMAQRIYNFRKMEPSIHGDKSILIVEEKTTGATGQLDRMVLLISTKRFVAIPNFGCSLWEL
ncbi:LOW QUALITY PROTEIN: hypothetical protein ACHAW5_005285 [Stephanodiscus triporus]|uniref:Uncharacterized protein n=1 Tax=Stephanodiscus triporus TaxID=2934178 RepID=A0ABD3PA05_9STRA